MRKRLISILLVLLIFFQPVFASDFSNKDYIRIAIIDTGISTMAIDAGMLAEGYNYVLDNKNTEDKIGHGTAVAGIIESSFQSDLSERTSGIKFVPLVFQTVDESGMVKKGDPELIAQAIRDAIDIYGCRVINLSLGTTLGSSNLSEAVEYAEEKNVVIVSSVGNKNMRDSDLLYYPAAYPTVIGVGSVNKYGRVSDFSQRNRSLTLVATGERIWTVSKNGKALLTNGTSFATALVSAAVAKLMCACPELTAEELRRILCETATDILEPGYDMASGWGILNFDKALTLVSEGR